MHILLSNDDGYLSPGLNILAERLARFATVTIVAPDRDRSGASNSLTLSRPLRPRQLEERLWVIDGTPSDCVHLGIKGLLPEMPDLVVSGINHGANLGDDVLYSGTVAAASEGRALGLPAIAASCQSFAPEYLESAAHWVEWLIRRLDNHPLPAYSLFNVNVPDAPLDRIGGVRATRLGRRHPSGQLVRDTDPRGREIVWIGAAGEAEDAGEGTDFHALARGWVSVTPIHFDMTRHETMPALEQWLT